MITLENLKKEELDNLDFENLEALIDKSIRSFHKWYPWEEAIIDGELSIEVRNKISQKYKDAGWDYVYHRTSSENGERPGLTSFKFSKTKLEDKYIQRYHMVQ